GKFQPIFQIVNESGPRYIEPDLLHGVFEIKTVFGFLNGIDAGADQLNVIFLENAAVGKLDGKIQRGLAADRGKNSKPGAGRHLALEANDFFQVFAGERLNVGAVGRLGVGHDGGRIRVRQHDFKALGLERFASLGAGVIELRRLANDDGARAEDEDFRDVSAFGHWLVQLFFNPTAGPSTSHHDSQSES